MPPHNGDGQRALQDRGHLHRPENPAGQRKHTASHAYYNLQKCLVHTHNCRKFPVQLPLLTPCRTNPARKLVHRLILRMPAAITSQRSVR